MCGVWRLVFSGLLQRRPVQCFAVSRGHILHASFGWNSHVFTFSLSSTRLKAEANLKNQFISECSASFLPFREMLYISVKDRLDDAVPLSSIAIFNPRKMKNISSNKPTIVDTLPEIFNWFRMTQWGSFASWKWTQSVVTIGDIWFRGFYFTRRTEPWKLKTGKSMQRTHV